MPSDSAAARGPISRSGHPGEALRILVVDENPRDRALIRESLKEAFPDSQTIEIEDPSQLQPVLNEGNFDLAVADHRPSWIDAFALLEKIREKGQDVPVLLCTGTGSEELAVAAVKAGFDDYLLKHPHHFPRLGASVRSALEEATRRRIAREAETRYRSLFEGVPVGLYRATLSGQILDANPALIELLGFPSRESLMAVNLREIHADPKARRGFLERLEREGEVHDLELSWKRYGGQIIWVRKGARPVRDLSGRLLHYEGVVEDITERKRGRQELQESNQFRQEIISGAGEGIIVFDRELRYVVWNHYMERMTGLPAGRVLGRKPVEVFPFLANSSVPDLQRRALAGETTTSEDVPYEVSETGRKGWAVGTYGPHRDAAGEIVGVIGMLHDVTERRRAEQALRESEERFRLMADAAPVMIWIDDAEGMSTYFSRPWLDFTGRSLERELGRGSRDGIHPDDLAGFVAVYDAALAARQPFHTECRLRRHDGEYRWIFDTAYPRFTQDGAFAGYIGSSIDITDRRKAEEALRESEARYRVQVEHAPEAIVVFDAATGRFVEANDNAVRLYRMPRERLFATGPGELSPPVQPDGRPSAEAAMEKIQQALDGGVPVFEWTHRDAEGRDIPCEVRLVRLPSATGRLVRGSVADISARKRSEKLRSALYRIAATASSAEDLPEFYAAIHGIVGELMYAKNFYVALHHPENQTLAFPYCVDEADPPPVTRPLRKGLTEYVLRTGEPLLMPDEEFPAILATGAVESVGAPSVDWLGVPLRSRGRTYGVLVVQSYDPRFRYGLMEKEVLTFVSQQIAVAIERKQAQEEIRESEERYRLLFERNSAGVYRATLSGRILECNDAMARIFGYASREELLGQDVRALYPGPRRRHDFLETLLSARSLVNYEMQGRRKDGSSVWTLENAALLAEESAGEIIVEGTLADITDRKVLEEKLRQSQKMEAIGQLAGGIAHDFNNLLTTVLGYSEMALQRLSPHEPIREEIEEIQRAGERAAKLTQQLLAFSRKQVFEPKVLDLNAMIAESSRMLDRLIGERIRLVTQLDPSLGSVRADPGQFEQVIVNLVVNARDAMPQGGSLTIRTQNVEVGSLTSLKPSGAPPGRWVAVSVSDTGVGIDADTQKRIFEPFFTTKEKPHGTGLGLATVYGIVSQSGGHIFVSSEPGRGAAFTVYLPRVDAAASRPTAPDPVKVRRGSETILLVEDEPAVRDLTRRCLEANGYSVIAASSAEEAQEIAAGHQGRFDLLLSDVVMPGDSGPELARRLLSSQPDLQVLFVSGYTDESVVSPKALEPGSSFLQKPFTPDALVRRVRELLDSGARERVTR